MVAKEDNVAMYFAEAVDMEVDSILGLYGFPSKLDLSKRSQNLS